MINKLKSTQKIIKDKNHENGYLAANKYTTKTLPVLLKEPKVLLIGGSSAAYQKAVVLKSNNIDFSIISISIKEKLKKLGINYELRAFRITDLKNYNIVIDATGSREVNSLLKKEKERKFFLLNSVDIPSECDFYFSSLLKYNNLKIAISSDGASPTLTQIVRDKIKEIIPQKIGELAEKKLLERSKGRINIERTKKETKKLFGKVFLVGCGPGSPELLTLRALKVIETSDIILHDNLIDRETLSFAKKDAQIFPVGKEKENHLYEQDEINKIMLEFANCGYKVARLKNGDPYIFGRGAEETEFLIDNSIDVEVIPGISSAFSAPLLAGIPPTHRNFSSKVFVVSGHQKDKKNELNWLELLLLKDHTTIVLMGTTKTEEILSKGLTIGVDRNLPAAFISNASNKNEKIIITKFEKIFEASNEIERPAVLVFGETVNFSKKLLQKKVNSNSEPKELADQNELINA